VVTADGVLLAANQPLLDLLGEGRDDLLGADWIDIMPGWEDRVRSWDAEGAEQPRTHTYEEHVMGAGGRELWAHVVATPIMTEGGEGDDGTDAGPALAAWTLFVSDNSPVLIDEAERRRREILDLLLESSGVLVVKLDADGCVDFVSPSLCAALGCSAEALLGQPRNDDHSAVADYLAQLAGVWEEIARPPFAVQREMSLRAPGSELAVAWTFEALIEDHGVVRGVFGLGRDVSERRRAEDALRRQLDLETMLASISTRLMAARAADMREVFDFALTEVGWGTGVDHVSMHELAADRVTVARGRVWRRRGCVVEASESLTTLADLDWLRPRLEAREIVTVADVGELPEEAEAERRLWGALGLCSIVVAPLVYDEVLVGFLALSTTETPRTWDEKDLHVLRVLTDQITSELVWYWDEMNLAAVSEGFLSFGPDYESNLESICAALGHVTGASFVLYDRLRGADLLTVASWHAPAGLPAVSPACGGLGAEVIARGGDDVEVIADLQDTVYAHTSPIVKAHRLRTYCGYPVKAEGRTVAALCALFDGDVTLRSCQLELFRVLGRAAAVEEARRLADEDRLRGLAQLEQAMERTVATLSGAMSTRDPYTAGHERRVAQLAVAIGGEVGMDDSELRLLRLAATVHDIGKIAVPAEILSKPSRLSAPEFAIIKGHSQAGNDLLEPAGLPERIVAAVRQHHERLDGSGYPDGLQGDAIGLFARILAVADVAEAMSSHRPYRPALGLELALKEIAGGRGVRFDAEICDVCLRLFREQSFTFVE
jgi:PAS domain S-box-containing protein